MTAWDLVPGDATTRQAVSERFGGAIQGGILPSSTTPNVMIYTDLSQGAQHGYDFDGWSRDDPEVFTTPAPVSPAIRRSRAATRPSQSTEAMGQPYGSSRPCPADPKTPQEFSATSESSP